MSYRLKDRLLIGGGEIWLNNNKIGTYSDVYTIDINFEKRIHDLIIGNSYLIKNEDKTYTIESEYCDYYIEFDGRNRIFLKKFNSEYEIELGYFDTSIIHNFISDHCINDKDIRTDIAIKYLFECRLKH